MDAAGWRPAGRAGGRQAVHTCDPFTLQTSHGSVSAQWATAAKQAKCRQTVGSARVPHLRQAPPGAGRAEQGGGRGAGWGGARGGTWGQLSLLEVALPGAAQVWGLQNSLLPSILYRRGWAGSGFLDVWNVHIGSQKASSGPQPSTLRCKNGWKAEGRKKVCFPRNADAGNRGLLRPSPPPAPESLTARQGRLRR